MANWVQMAGMVDMSERERLVEGMVERLKEFDLIIDARTSREFNDGHIPGAVNMPVVDNDEFAEVGTLHRTDEHGAYVVGAKRALVNIAQHLDRPEFKGLNSESRILVCCFRGGKRSTAWANVLKPMGFNTSIMPGGWKAFRLWSLSKLEESGKFDYRVITGLTGVGKTKILAHMKDLGAQVIDLEGLAKHRGSVFGGMPGVEQPSQKVFETELLWELRALDPTKPVIVEAESRKIGRLGLPAAMHQAMRAAPHYELEADVGHRAELCIADYGHLCEDEAFLVLARQIKRFVSSDVFEQWMADHAEKRFVELVSSMLKHHYDPLYRNGMRSCRVVGKETLAGFHEEEMKRAAASLLTQMQEQMPAKWDSA